MAFLDWDKDGYLDVLELYDNRCQIGWFKQIRDHHDSVPTFEKGILLPYNTDYHIDNFAAVDWNRDGFMDLLICLYWSPHVILVMTNDGQDSFGSTHEIAGNLSSCNFLKGLDFDSDGDVDLIVDTRYFERTGDNSLEERTGSKNPLQIVVNHYQLWEENQLWAVEDWDNDGDLDLLIARRFNFDANKRHLTLIEQLSDGTFREPVENPFRGINWEWWKYTGGGRMYLADLNGDGLMDLWNVGSWMYGCDYVSEYPHVREDQVLVEHHISTNPTNPFLDLNLRGDEFHWVDWNEDGLMDLISSRTRCNGVSGGYGNDLSCLKITGMYHRNQEPAVRYFQGQEDGSLRENHSVFEDVDAGHWCRISVADWDGDGHLDLIVISLISPVGVRSSVSMSFYQNQGGKLVLSPDSALSQIDGLAVRETSWGVEVPSQPLAVDWDDDGFTDLILAPEGRFFRRKPGVEKESSLIEVAENPFKSLPSSAATDLQWRLFDCDGDGDLDLIRLDERQQINACERQGDGLNCSSNFKCLEWEEEGGPQKIYAFDVWREGGILSFLGTPLVQENRPQFWSQGFCLPAQQCNEQGRCNNLRGVCDCVGGHNLDDCSGCGPGFAKGPEGGGCQACAADHRGVTCSGRGICRDDHFAQHQSNVSNSTRPLMKGDGHCLCTEDTFGGVDAAGKVNCQSGRCSDGYEEVVTVEAALVHCQQCPAGSSSVGGAHCSPCLPGTMAGLGSATCESCKAGHFAATVGSSECHLCRAGSYAAAGSHECSRCPPGTYSSIAATKCTPCQEGWVAEGWGNPTCKPCLAGTYAHEGRLCRQCPGNTISTLGRSKCEPCVGSFLLAYADAERVTCHASMTSLFVGLMTAVCLIIALMLSAWLCFYQLHIEDLSLQDHGLVVTTSRPHRLLWRWGACITLKNTGSQPLEDLQKRRPYRARTLSGKELQLIHDETVGPWDTTMGSVRIHFPSTLFHTGFLRIPSLLWLIFLLIPMVVTLILGQLLLRMLLLIIASAALISSVLWIAFYWMSSRTSLARRHRLFREKLQRLHKTRVLKSCPRGPERAITIGQVGQLYEFFQSFIKDRSMYYICSNLVIPVTEDCKLSYAELVGPRQVNWFVSHYWGTPFQEFVAAVRHNAKSDGAVDWQSTAYWICTFSNNQWEVEAELGQGDYQESSFYKSLRSESCEGTVMVLDEQALPLRRAWCLFELLQTKLIASERASSFQGLLLCTSSGVLRNGKGGIEIAMKVATCLATLDLRDAKATDERDLVMIQSLVEKMPGGFHATNAFVRKSIRDCLILAHQNFEVDFGKLLEILNENLPAEDALPTLLSRSAARPTAIGDKKDGE